MKTRAADSRSFPDRRKIPDRRIQSSPFIGEEKRSTGERRRNIERRMHPRFKAKKLTFIKLSSENEEDMAQLLNISRGGLSLRYFEDAGKEIAYSKLDILSPDADFNINKIPFRTISSDIKLTFSPYFRPRHPIELRRCGVAFEGMTAEQTSRLDYFLSNHASGA